MSRRPLIRVKDLPAPRPGHDLPDGGHVEAQQPVLYCEWCGGEYSANPSDYFAAPPDRVLECCEEPLRLVLKRTVYEDVVI